MVFIGWKYAKLNPGGIYLKKYMYVAFATVLFASFFLVGCTEKTESETQDENIQTIEAVLKNNLNGPDDELIQIVNDVDSYDNLEAQRKYEENLYKEYFADEEAFLEYVNYYGTTLLIEPIKNNVKLKVKNIEWEKTDSKEIIYNFKVELEYQKEGNDKSEIGILNGQANVNEEHKIERMKIHINEFWGSFDTN